MTNQQDWPMSDDPLSWPIERWKWMFDNINDDCLNGLSDSTYVPFSDIEYYADQIVIICDNCGQEISDDDALIKAQQLLQMEIVDMCAVLVMQNNLDNTENEPSFGATPETAEAVLQGLFEDIAEVVEKKQRELISK